MIKKLWAWLLPIKGVEAIEDFGQFALMLWWDICKTDYIERTRRIGPAYKIYKEAQTELHFGVKA